MIKQFSCYFPPTVNSYLDFCHALFLQTTPMCIYKEINLYLLERIFVLPEHSMVRLSLFFPHLPSLIYIAFHQWYPLGIQNHIYCTAVIVETRRWLPLEAWCMRAQALSVNLFHKRVVEKHLIWLWNYTDEIDWPKIIQKQMLYCFRFCFILHTSMVVELVQSDTLVIHHRMCYITPSPGDQMYSPL